MLTCYVDLIFDTKVKEHNVLAAQLEGLLNRRTKSAGDRNRLLPVAEYRVAERSRVRQTYATKYM
jgi:hypothetical protein